MKFYPAPGRAARLKICWKADGNALFIILIAVALFGALSYAVTESSRMGGTSTQKEELMLTTSRIMQFGDNLRLAILQMQLDGIAQADIELYDGDQDTICTTGTNCLFAPEGGQQNVMSLPDYVDKDEARVAYFEWYEISDGFAIPTINNGDPVLAFFIMNVSEETCLDVNQRLGLGTAIPDQSTVEAGTYAVFENAAVGCFQNSGRSSYIIYHVISP